jgi:hypothetical protein
MNYSPNSLVLIGEGAWSKKVGEILSKHDNTLELNHYSARNFLQLSSENVSRIVSNNLIWITTRPDLQISILKKIININSKVIVEKPVANNIDELNRFFSALTQSNSKVFLSVPWTYSAIWTQIKRYIENCNGPLEVNIQRGGPNLRTYMNPVNDWIFHDLTLLAQLLQPYRDAIELNVVEINQKNLTIAISVPKLFKINLNVGYLDKRTALWQINNLEVFDFHLSTDNFDNPLWNMFTEFKNIESTDDIRDQLWLIERVFNII